ncbi:hypothetical protein [Streptomyces sp. NPDC020141]
MGTAAAPAKTNVVESISHVTAMPAGSVTTGTVVKQVKETTMIT